MSPFAAPEATPVVWLSLASLEASAEAQRALDEWARARGMRLVSPSGAPSPGLPVDLAATDRIEAELERARDAIAALDPEAAALSLARAEAILRAHPELPQAAFLLAEVERGWASRFLRIEPRDPERAALAWQRAAGLDGGRAPGVGETAAPPPQMVSATVLWDAGADVVARLDGAVIAQGTASASAGDHQLTFARDGAIVWASWVTISPGAVLHLGLPKASSCSNRDLSRASIDSALEVHADGIACASFVVARQGEEPGTILVAHCERDRCGPWLEWRAQKHAFELPQVLPPRSKWPAWATWTVVGVSAAAVTTVVLAAAGAFDARASETRFVNGGVKVEAFR